MAVISEVNFLQLEDRMDAEYYRPDYLKTMEKLRECNAENLEKYVSIRNGYPFSSTMFNFGDVPLIKITDIKDFIDVKNLITIPREYLDEIGFIFPKENDIILGMDGTDEFRASIITEDLVKCAINQRIAIITTKDPLLAQYLFVFFKTQYGATQLVREKTTATTVGHISNRIIKNVQVVIPRKKFQNHIKELVSSAFQMKKHADSLYKDGIKLLYVETGIDKLKITEEKMFEATFSQIEETQRLDAEYYRPKFTKIMQILKKNSNVKTLAEISKSIISGSYIRDYSSGGTFYLRVQNIRETEIDLRDVKFVDIEQSKIPDRIRVKADDVLLTRTGTTGVAFVAEKELEGAVISQHVTRITLRENFDPYYVAACLNSQIGRLQAERAVAGTMQKELIHSSMKKMKIPIITLQDQQKISEKIKESLKQRRKAQDLILKAKRKVANYMGINRELEN